MNSYKWRNMKRSQTRYIIKRCLKSLLLKDSWTDESLAYEKILFFQWDFLISIWTHEMIFDRNYLIRMGTNSFFVSQYILRFLPVIWCTHFVMNSVPLRENFHHTSEISMNHFSDHDVTFRVFLFFLIDKQ